MLKEGAAVRFHYGSFLVKKAWRLLPLWFVTVTAVCAVSFGLYGEYLRLETVLETAQYSAVFGADYYIDHSGNYFNIFSQQNPLLHFWYLSVTQQLYLLAPLIVIPLARRCSRRIVLVTLGILALISLIYNMLTVNSAVLSFLIGRLGLLPADTSEVLLRAFGAKSAYYHLLPRFWEIVAGLLVMILPEWRTRPMLRQLLGLLGLVGLVATFYLFGTGSPYVCFPVAATVLALRYADGGLVGRALACKPVQALGTISFSLYLWHWPIMVFWKYCSFDAPSVWDEVGMVVTSFLMASLSWYVLERLPMPARGGRVGTLLRSSIILLLPLVACAALKGNAYAKKTAHTTPQRIIHAWEEKDADVLRGLERMREYGLDRAPLRMGAEGGQPTFLLMGDSHAAHLYSAMDAVCRESGMCGLFLNNSVATFWNVSQPRMGKDTYCWNPDIAHMLLAYLQQHPEVKAVLIAQAWYVRFTQMPGAYDWRTGKSLPCGEERRKATVAGLGELCDRIRALGKVPVLLGDVPHFDGLNPVDEWLRCSKLGKQWQQRCVTDAEHVAGQLLPHRVLSQLRDENRASYIDLAASLRERGRYPAVSDGVWLYADSNHLTYEGALRVAKYLMDSMLSVLQGNSGDEASAEALPAA